MPHESKANTILEHLAEGDVLRAAAGMPRSLAEHMKSAKPGSVMVAGGHVRDSITGEKSKDIDVFTEGDEATKQVVEVLGGEEKSQKTDNAYTFLSPPYPPIQVIHRWTFARPEDLVSHFDFTVIQAMVFWSGEKWSGRCSWRFYRDLASRRLVFDADGERGSLEKAGTLLRMMKYARKGYRPTLTTVTQVACDAAGVDYSDDLMRDLLGIDPAYWPDWVREQADALMESGEGAP